MVVVLILVHIQQHQMNKHHNRKCMDLVLPSLLLQVPNNEISEIFFNIDEQIMQNFSQAINFTNLSA